jgi:hypothetical protein
MKTTSWGAVLFALVAAAGVMVAGYATAAAAANLGPGSRYVALGSSYAAGPGIEVGQHSACKRSAHNYAHQLAAARHWNLVDVSCSGATTANILRKGQYPGVGPQLQAITADTSVVTVTIGGNDLDYVGQLGAASALNRLLKAPGGRSAAGRGAGAEPAPPGPAAYDRLRHSLVDTVTAVRSRSKHAVVVFVDYLGVLGPNAATCAAVPLTPAEARSVRAELEHLDATIAQAAADTSAVLVRAGAAGAPHGACSASPWVTGVSAPTPFHPNLAGMTAVAGLIDKQLSAVG